MEEGVIGNKNGKGVYVLLLTVMDAVSARIVQKQLEGSSTWAVYMALRRDPPQSPYGRAVPFSFKIFDL